MIDLDALQWHPRTDVFPDAKDTWIAFPNGYCCHIIYRESTKDSWGWQVIVVRDNMLIGAPMQHHDPQVIDKILKQVESGKLFQHVDKDKHMEMMLEAEKSLGRDEGEILKDFERDLPVLGKMMMDPNWALRNIQWLLNEEK
jgi:hexokinase